MINNKNNNNNSTEVPVNKYPFTKKGNNYWSNLRNEAAIAALQGLLAGSDVNGESNTYKSILVNHAIGYANTLIKGLQSRSYEYQAPSNTQPQGTP